MAPTTLIIYAYSHSDNYDSLANLNYFLKVVIVNNPDYYFIIVSNGQLPDIIQQEDNIHVIQRDNTGYDFGAWAAAIDTIKIDDYNYFVFINSSVRGPFLPSYVDSYQWPTILTQRLEANDDSQIPVKLVGTTINVLGWPMGRGHGIPVGPHVQSMCWATDKIGLLLLIKKGILASADNKLVAITNHEVAMSQVMLEHGYNIDCLLVSHQNRQWSSLNDTDWILMTAHNSPVGGDVTYRGQYYGQTLHPYEVMFIKTSRDLDIKQLDYLTLNHLRAL